jgi:hypothetical protein
MKTAIAILLATITTACGQQIKLSNVKAVEITLGETNNQVLPITQDLVRFQFGEDKIKWKIAGEFAILSLRTNVYTNWFELSRTKIEESANVLYYKPTTFNIKEVGTIQTQINLTLERATEILTVTVVNTVEEWPSQTRYRKLKEPIIYGPVVLTNSVPMGSSKP